MEEAVDREELLPEGWDRLDGNHPDATELAREFEARESQDQPGKEVERLKALLGETCTSDFLES